MSTLVLIKDLLLNVTSTDSVSNLLLNSAVALLDGEIEAEKARSAPAPTPVPKGPTPRTTEDQFEDFNEAVRKWQDTSKKYPYEPRPWTPNGPWGPDKYILYSAGTIFTEAAQDLLSRLNKKDGEG